VVATTKKGIEIGRRTPEDIQRIEGKDNKSIYTYFT